MYLVVIGWVYVVLMMCVVEATSSNGTLLGAFITFVLYGLVPVTLVVYLMRAPQRNKVIKAREAEERLAAQARHAQNASAEVQVEADVEADVEVNGEADGKTGASAALDPDAGGHAAGGVQAVAADPRIASMREEAQRVAHRTP